MVLLQSPAMKSSDTPDIAPQGASSPGRRDGRSKALVAASWAAVAAVAALIYAMSAKDGVTLDTGSGLLSAAKAWLAEVLSAAAGHPVDVSPIGHFAEYLLLGCVLANALRLHVAPPRAAAIASVAASLYGITDEIHQIFVPLRSCDPADWAVDTVAACIGAVVASALAARRSARTRASADR